MAHPYQWTCDHCGTVSFKEQHSPAGWGAVWLRKNGRGRGTFHLCPAHTRALEDMLAPGGGSCVCGETSARNCAIHGDAQ